MPERVRKRRRIAVLSAFFDESGTDPRVNKALIMGGFLGDVEEWERASEAWDGALHQHPPIEYFSHNEAQSLNGQFARFRRETADAKVLALANTIAQFPAIRGMATGVSYSWFLHRDLKAAKGMIGTRAYDWGFNTVTSGVLQYVDSYSPGDGRVDFVFDERRELNACIQMFEQMKANPFFASSVMRRAGQCSPGDDEEIAALQMADLLAWECSKVLETRTRSDAFNIIVGKNLIVNIRCQPPRRLPDVLRIQKLANAIKQKAIEVLIRTKKTSLEPFLSAEDVEKSTNELLLNHASFGLEWSRLVAQFHNDEEIQTFFRRYSSSRQMTKDSEFERFDRTMRQLMKVPHEEIKAALDAEKAAKKRKKKAGGPGF
jgi:hypothetical protein